MPNIQFIDMETNEKILRFYEINYNLIFNAGEEIIVEGSSYRFVKKSTSFYKDADGEQILISLFLER